MATALSNRVLLLCLCAPLLAAVGMAQDGSAGKTSVKTRLVDGALALAKEQLNANAADKVGRGMLDFAELLGGDTDDILLVRRRLALGKRIAKADKAVDRAAYVELLVMLAGRDKSASRATALFAAANLLDPANKAAADALAKAKAKGRTTDFEALVTRKVSYFLSRRVKYADSLAKICTGVFDQGLDDGMPLLEGYLGRLLNTSRERQKACEADSHIAKKAEQIGRELGNSLATRKKHIADLEKLNVARPGLTRRKTEQHKEQEAALRARRAQGIRTRWDKIAKSDGARARRSVEQIRRLEEELTAKVVIRDELRAMARDQEERAVATAKSTAPKDEAGVPRLADLGLPGTGKAFADDSFYDTKPAPTPAALKSVVAESGMWLQSQRGRMGGSIATRMFAKKNGERATLYIYVNDKFQRLPRVDRARLAQGIWGFWAMRCVSNKKTSTKSRAFLALVNKAGGVVGGSDPIDAGSIWVD